MGCIGWLRGLDRGWGVVEDLVRRSNAMHIMRRRDGVGRLDSGDWRRGVESG